MVTKLAITTNEEAAKIIFELLMQDVKHKRLDIGIRDSSLDTRSPRLCPEIQLTTDDSVITLTVATVLRR
jgi:hypothetical protein